VAAAGEHAESPAGEPDAGEPDAAEPDADGAAAGGAGAGGPVTRARRARSFGAVAADYDRLRPAPPDPAVRWALPADCGVAVDLAAGTGLLTRVVARYVPRVVAVEPDERMRAQFRARAPQLEVRPGRAEAIPLPDGFADTVLVGSAWHWVDPERALPEIARVLRVGGRLAVLWTGRDRTVGWVRELSAGPPGWSGLESGPGPDAPDVEHRRELRVPAGGPFGPPEPATFGFTRTMPLEDLVAWLGTHSAVLVAPPAQRAAYLGWARAELRRRFPGAERVTVPMRARCWRAERRPV
jgi:SAM-dependent methyltransferase